MNEHVRTRLRQDWCDTLADYTIFQIQQACKEALGGKASEAMNEEKIKNLIIMARGRRLAAIPKPPEPPPPPRVTADKTAEIMAEIGFKVNRIEGTDQ